MEIMTRKQAFYRNMDKYYTGKPCQKMHDGFRYVSTGACTECAKEYVKRYQRKIPKWKRESENPKYEMVFLPAMPEALKIAIENYLICWASNWFPGYLATDIRQPVLTLANSKEHADAIETFAQKLSSCNFDYARPVSGVVGTLEDVELVKEFIKGINIARELHYDLYGYDCIQQEKQNDN